MNELFERLSLVIGEIAIENLKHSKVLVIGLGGVGGFVVETLIRSGVGKLIIIDYDKVEDSNFNRQLIANVNNLGSKKTTIFKEFCESINPNCQVTIIDQFLFAEDIAKLNYSGVDFIVDAIDTVSTKIAIIEYAKKLHIPCISAMGFGNKLDSTQIRLSDISKTSACPLARVMRTELKKRNISGVMVAYSLELPIKPTVKIVSANSKVVVGSYMPVVASAGILMADYVLKYLWSK